MIKVDNLCKQYRQDHGQKFYALKDVTFEVSEGEVLGIVGANGSGKTTLLSIILGAVYPTSGAVKVDAPIASLLDLGIGFSEDFTGEYNVRQSAALQGCWNVDMKAVADFSECGAILDRQFKRYSSGERVRLQFAVLAQLPQPIVLVDDLLAWADPNFRDKAMGYIAKVAREGRTVMLVSHIPERLETLADRVMWLNKGEIVEIGEPAQVLRHYERGVAWTHGL